MKIEKKKYNKIINVAMKGRQLTVLLSSENIYFFSIFTCID